MLSNLFLGANATIAFCYFVIAFLIFRGLMRGQQHLLKNPLVVATAAIFLTCALGHSAHILVMPTGEKHADLPLMSIQVGFDWITASVAVTYLALRRHYSLLIDGPLLLAQTENQLAQANEKLIQVNANLEFLVAERTEELLKTNQQLKREIAERQGAESALRNSYKLKDELLVREQTARQQVTNILESNSDAFFALDNDWQFTYLNPKAEQLLQRSRDELLGNNIWQEFPEAVGTVFDREYHRAVAENVTVQFEAFYARFKMWVDVRAYPAANGVSVYFQDITQRKQAEEALRQSEEFLRQSEERYRSLVVASSQIVWTTNSDGQVVDMPQWRAYTGQSQEAVLGWGWLDALHPEDRDRTAKIWSHAVAAKGVYNTEYRVRSAEGNYCYFSVRGVPVLAEDGSIREWVGTCTDISDRKRAEQQIKELNQDLERRVVERTTQLEAANKELEAFAYSVSHDLRAPLRSIDGFSLALLERYGSQFDDKGKHYLQRVRAASQRMGELIDDLLNLSRVTRIEMQHQTVNLSALVHEIVSDLQQTQPERPVEFIIAPKVVAQGDPRLLKVVLENLVNNAWKFTSNKAHPQIEFGILPHSYGTTAYFVSDNGAGFDMAYANKLFGAFQRLHTADEFPGTGIGLATVQRIIHRHGGRVWAEGAVDLGAKFYFSL